MNFKLKSKATRETLKMTGCIVFLYFLIQLFSWGVQWKMGVMKVSAIGIAGGFAGVVFVSFFIFYVYYDKAQKRKSVAWYLVLYGSMKNLEERLNVWGSDGYCCEKIRPDLFLVKMRYAGEPQVYKASYVTVEESRRFKNYIEERSKGNWKYVPSFDNNGSTPAAIFMSPAPAADFLDAERHSLKKIGGWLTIAVLLNVLISAFGIGVAVYVLPGVVFAAWLAGAITTICVLQIIVRIKIFLLPGN